MQNYAATNTNRPCLVALLLQPFKRKWRGFPTGSTERPQSPASRGARTVFFFWSRRGPKRIWAQISAMKAETPHQKTTLPFVHPIRRTERNPTRPLPPIPSLLVPPARQSLWGSGGWAPSRSQPGRHEPGQFMCRYPLFSPELYELDGMKSQPIYHGLSAGSSVLYCYFLSSVTLLCSYSLRYIKT
jgi:hypothetical protein